MNGINALRRLFGLHPMEEAGADGGNAGGSAPAPAAPAAPTATSLLGSEPAAPAAPTEGQPAAEPAAEGQPAAEGGEKAAEGDEKKPGADEVPEAYADFTLPEGVTLDDLDQGAMPEVHALFKDLGLSQEKADMAFSRLLQIQQAMAGTPEQQQQQMEQNIIELNANYAQQCRELPDIGGANFEASLEQASKVMATFGDPDVRMLLTYTGVGSHPAFFKFIHSISTRLSPDTFVNGGEQAQPNQRPADVLFGNLF